jgi:hypothetical protein
MVLTGQEERYYLVTEMQILDWTRANFSQQAELEPTYQDSPRSADVSSG